MKTKLHFVALFLVIVISLPLSAQTGDQKSGGDKSEFDIPADFFDNMFRAPSDEFLVAWHGGVKISLVDSKGETTAFSGSVRPFEKFLNEGFNDLFGSYFTLNMKDGKKQIVSPNEKVWAARCGLKSSNNINISRATGKEIKGFPAEITSDVWSKAYILKRSYTDPVSHKKVVEQYRLEATSIYYYDKSENDLEGSIKRDDGYKLCGRLLFQRRGPGMSGTVVESTGIDAEAGKYHFEEVLHRGDYQVSYKWPHGGRIILDEDFVYNPSNPKMSPDFTISAFTGKIQGKVVYKETNTPAKDYPVRIVPVCSSSGLPTNETKTDGNGNYTFVDIPAGEYNIVVNGSENTEAFLIKKGETLKPDDSRISFSYNIRAYYNAPGFAKAGMVWKNSTIKFPESNDEIQFFDVMTARNSGEQGHPKGTDGKPLTVPFSMIIPGIGKQIMYGVPEKEIPEVMYVNTLGGSNVFTSFKINREDDALNSCAITQINGGPIYLEFGFDLTGKYVTGQDDWQQVNVRCVDDLETKMVGERHSAYPIEFRSVKFSEEDIKQFKKYEKVEKTISNGRATLKVVFEPQEK